MAILPEPGRIQLPLTTLQKSRMRARHARTTLRGTGRSTVIAGGVKKERDMHIQINHGSAPARAPVIRLLLATTVATLLTGTLAVAPTIVHAGEPNAERVRVADLDLATPQGRRTLDRRVSEAIERVCAPSLDPLPGSVRALTQVRVCSRRAREQVQGQLAAHGLPALLTASSQ
jgi:UrcA family protein